MKVKELLEGRSVLDNGPGKIKAPKINYSRRGVTMSASKPTASQKAEVRQKPAKPEVVKGPKGPRPSQPGTLSKEDYAAVGAKIEQLVGNAFPDSDPNDTVFPWVSKAYDISNNSSDKVRKILDKAVKTLGRYKNYDDYLAKIWDQYLADYPDEDVKARGNPWK